MPRTQSEDERVFFWNQLREARAGALRNAEDFDGLLFAVERLGSLLTGGNERMGLVSRVKEDLERVIALGLLPTPT
jgi:hypothetical protein